MTALHPPESPIRRLGGLIALRTIIEDFVQRMVDDAMIGFMFRDADLLSLAQREFEFTARFLGANVPYTGRPLRDSHAPHRIMGGQFDRRKQILHEVLMDHRVPPDLRAQWLDHVEKLRPVITAQGRGVCTEA
ncbi:MAG: group 1 truncated hemoglobin [Myxococcales bacterium]|nr:group 1 truncated hemoglobin [Myxococcales bacterium]